MSRISIDKNIQPGQKVTFRVDMEFFGYGKTIEFDFDAPNAAPLMSRVDNIIVKNEAGKDLTKTKGNFAFSFYRKGPNIKNKNTYRLVLRLNNAKEAMELIKGEKVLLTTTSPALSALNNKEFFILADENENPKNVHIEVNQSFQPTGSSGGVTGSLQEVTGIVKTRKYTVNLPKNVVKGLISEKPSEEIRDGSIEDIPIFAYARFKGNNNTNLKKKLMSNDQEVKEKEPPDRNDILDYRKNLETYSQTFPLTDKNNFIFYVAIARYIYDKKAGKWKKQWVQTNSADEVLWGKAREKK